MVTVGIVITRKTQELSELRKDLDNKQSELDNNLSDLTRERAEYREMLPKIKAMLQNGFVEEPNWESLKEQDQVEYLTKKQEWDEHLNKIKSVDAELVVLLSKKMLKGARTAQKTIIR